MRLDAGNAVLNGLLKGGYDENAITVIYGPPGVGKTCAALLAALAQAQQRKVFYIDTEGGFSVERLRQLCQNKKLLQKISFVRPSCFEEQERAIEALGGLSQALIVIDTVSSLFRLERTIGDAESRKWNRRFCAHLHQLLKLSMQNTILLTNQVYQTGSGIAMVCGDILAYFAKCLIELRHAGKLRKARLVKHRALPSSEALFKIVESGFEPVSNQNPQA